MNKVYAVHTNPNETAGGGGCLCHEVKSHDTKGPFVVIEGSEMDNPLSPFPVICAHCVGRCVTALKGEIGPGGEVVNGTAEEDDEVAI